MEAGATQAAATSMHQQSRSSAGSTSQAARYGSFAAGSQHATPSGVPDSQQPEVQHAANFALEEEQEQADVQDCGSDWDTDDDARARVTERLQIRSNAPTNSEFVPHNRTKTKVSLAIRAAWRAPLWNWKTKDAEAKAIKARIWDRFRDHVIIEEGAEEGVRKAFNKRASGRLQQLWTDIKKKKKMPDWMGAEDYARLWKHWEEDEGYQKRSAAATAARKLAAEKGGNKHTGGSASRGESDKKLEKKFGRPPTQSEGYRNVHVSKDDPERWVEEIAKERYDIFQDVMAEAVSQAAASQEAGVDDSIPPIDERELWLKTFPPTHGRSYGVGPVPSQSSSRSVTSRSRVVEDVDCRLEVQKLNEELSRQQEERKKLQADMELRQEMDRAERARLQADMAAMRASFDEQQRLMQEQMRLMFASMHRDSGVVMREPSTSVPPVPPPVEGKGKNQVEEEDRLHDEDSDDDS